MTCMDTKQVLLVPCTALLSAVLLAIAAGRYYSVDQWLTPRLGRFGFLAAGVPWHRRAPAAFRDYFSRCPSAPKPNPLGEPQFITAGPDGNLWFTALSGNAIGRITTAGSFTAFPIPTASSGPQGITAGPDGNMWFTERDGNKIGRITPSGAIIEFPLPKKDCRSTNSCQPQE